MIDRIEKCILTNLNYNNINKFKLSEVKGKSLKDFNNAFTNCFNNNGTLNSLSLEEAKTLKILEMLLEDYKINYLLLNRNNKKEFINYGNKSISIGDISETICFALTDYLINAILKRDEDILQVMINIFINKLKENKHFIFSELEELGQPVSNLRYQLASVLDSFVIQSYKRSIGVNLLFKYHKPENETRTFEEIIKDQNIEYSAEKFYLHYTIKELERMYIKHIK